MEKKCYFIFILINFISCFSVIGANIDSLQKPELPDINNIKALKAYFNGINGDGVIVCQKENSPDFQDIDLIANLIPSVLSAKEQTTHATEIAKLIVGSGVSSVGLRGVAPHSKLMPISFSNLLPENKSFYKNNNISFVNHSYGSAVDNLYNETALAYDSLSVQLPWLLNVFSAGNSGQMASGSGIYEKIKAFANITGSYKLAKNVLTIGAVDVNKNVLISSSRGPAFDGRIKPELVAFGKDGTSASSALVTGILALLKQIYQQNNSEEMPAALAKAILINTADDIGKSGPDYESGFGNVNAYKAGKAMQQKKYFSYTLHKGQFYNYDLELPVGAKNLKVTLAWDDPPAKLNSLKALVNDLDLTISDGKKTYFPWKLNVYPNVDSLNKLAFCGVDTLNNVEQISLLDDLSTHYTLRIDANKIKTAHQTFLVAFDWDDSNTFEWLNPLPGQTICWDKQNLLRWHTTYTEKNARLEISDNNGETWSQLTSGINLAHESINVDFPRLFKKTMLRMVLPDTTYQSGTFTLAPSLLVPVPLYVCTDSVELTASLNDSFEGEKYRLYKFDKTIYQWNLVSETTENNFKLKQPHKTDVFAIERVSKGGVSGGIGDALDLNKSDVGCFFKYFSATKEGNAVRLNLQLSVGTPDSVIFMKSSGGNFVPFVSSAVNNQLNFTGVDSVLHNGPNNYLAKLILDNNAASNTPIETVLIIATNKFFVYPVPAKVGTKIIFRGQKYDDYRFKLYNTHGEEMINSHFSDSIFSLTADFLNPGTYIYSIENPSHSVSEKGKIIIQ